MYLRKGNLKFTVTQDNIEKRLLVENLEKMVDDRRGGDYFGYKPEDLQGRDFRNVLSDEVSEILNDNIEYSLEGNDFKTVVEKIINFKILNAEKNSIDMNAYIERAMSTPEKLSFSVVLERKIFLQEKIKSILASIAEFQQVLHDVTGLIDTGAYYEVLNEVMDFLYDTRVEGVLCIISIEGFPQVSINEGRDKTDDILAAVGKVLTSTLRTRDIIGYLGFGKFAVFMVRTFEDEVIYPIKRLESNLRKQNLLTTKTSFNIRYQRADTEMEAKDLIDIVKNKQIDYTMNPVR